ncbi:hypothetical protein KUTeg_006525 [Tegillarca granosa]|uniref:Short-chain collagen C4 n=1 Tax=Tegillarca granosa TaxID=220873 RepID=A0ABQ9FF30_TEGGR|nr:hypothetical protein KUTeg_006525 [Tegillarca granosa]
MLLLVTDPDFIQNRFMEMEAKIQSLTTKLTELTQRPNTGGAVYIRWGKKECPNNGTELVYRGFAGGGSYTDSGSPAEYVCLPEDPVWGDHYDDSVSRVGKMYGAEYESSFFGKNYKAHYDDVPCAVCRSITRSSVLMIPGRNVCYQGWTREYSGNLAAGDKDHTAASQFVCVDHNPEAVPHGANNYNGKLFYVVEGVCGSLPCPPYVNGRELSCVVCTK